MFTKLVLTTLLSATLSAQYMPTPNSGTRQPRPRNTAPNKRSDTPNELLFKFEGTVKESSKKEFVVEVEGEQSLTFRRAKDLKVLAEKDPAKDPAKDKSLPIGTKISVEAKREMNGDLTAMIVHLTPEPKAQ